MPNRIENTDNNINSTGTDKLTVAKGCKKKVSVLLVLVVIIIGKRLIKDAAFIIYLTIAIGLVYVSVVGADMKKIVKVKPVRVFARAGNINEVTAS